MVAIMLKTWHRMKQVIFSLALSMCSPREKKMCEWLDSNVSLIPRQVQERATGLSRSSETLVQRIFSTLRGQLQYKRNSVNTKETWTPGPFSGHLRALHCPASLLCQFLSAGVSWLFCLEETHCPLVGWMETHRDIQFQESVLLGEKTALRIWWS